MRHGLKIAAALFGLFLVLPALSCAFAEGRYSGKSDGSRVGSLPQSLGNSFTGRYEGVYRFSDKSTLRNSENNRSQFKNSFAKRSDFGSRQDRVSKLKLHYERDPDRVRRARAAPARDVVLPAARLPRLGEASGPPLDAGTRKAIGEILRAHAARQAERRGNGAKPGQD